jgi:Protein of unknown function (DUF2510)
MPIPAGWYPDPLGSLQQRWWNGERWTEEIAPYRPTLSQVPADPYTPPEISTVLPAYSVVSAYGAVQAYTAEPAFAVAPVIAPATPMYFSAEQNQTTHTSAIAEQDLAVGGYQPFAYEMVATVSKPSGRILALPTQRYTASIWLFAVTPLIFAIASVGLSFAPVGVYSRFSQVSLVVLAISALIVFAIRDRRELGFAGYTRTASAWWIILSPIAYLIARSVNVRRQTGTHATAPLILGIFVVMAIVAFALLQPSTLAQVLAAAPV